MPSPSAIAYGKTHRTASVRRIAAIWVWLALGLVPAFADGATLRRAIADAVTAFETARPALGSVVAGVDVARYGAALIERRVGSGSVDYVLSGADDPGCARFAAYVAPVDGSASRFVFVCPRFFSPGADALRRLTILHELVHVVSDADECRAMAFAAAIEQASTGRFTAVDTYWRRNGCETSRFSLPL
jgi:hypothetical protein